MLKRQSSLLAVAIASVGLSGCLDSGGPTNKNADPNYELTSPQIKDGTSPVFAPLETQFPIPSDALFFLSEVDDGTMLNGSDPTNPVTDGLGYLDGNSLLAPIDIKITASIDANQTLDARDFVRENGEETGRVIPNPDQNIFFFPLEYAGGDSLKQVDGEVAGLPLANQYRRAQALLATDENSAEAQDILSDLMARQDQIRIELINVDGGPNNAIRIYPLEPLAPKTKYAVVLTNDIVDAQGKALVGSPTYQSVSDTRRVLSNVAFQAFRDAMAPPRDLAAEYFSFKDDNLSGAVLPTFEDITFSTTLTTTGIDDVLLANAAPSVFFQNTTTIEVRQAAISQLISGFYNVSNQPLADATATQSSINTAIYNLLTDPTFRLYDATLAGILEDANSTSQSLSFADVAGTGSNLNRRLAFVLQTAASEAAVAERASEISTTADTLASAVEAILDTPKTRPVRFFSEKTGGDINPALEQNVQIAPPPTPAVTVNIRVYEGEITLPYFQNAPEDGDGTPLKTGTWTAADFSADDTLLQAPSSRITYRFPFAQKHSDTKVPIVVAAPSNESAAQRPANGYPVIIYQHAATTDRSAILTLGTAAGLTCLTNSTNDAGDPDSDCFVTIGIDQPLHGIYDEGLTSARDEANGVPGMIPITEQPNASPDAVERHFGFAADADLAPVPANQVAAPGSGDLFLNFTGYANTVDNMRQGTLDLLNINASLADIEEAISTGCIGDGNCDNPLDIDPTRVYFMTHSLSGMGGVSFTHINNTARGAGKTELPEILASVFFNTGGHFTRFVENSSDIAQRLLPVLDSASDGLLTQGRTELNLYFNIFQSLLDSAGPSTYAPFYRGTNTLLTEIAGTEGNPDLPSDRTVPNAADAERFNQGPLSLVIPETGFVIDSPPAPLAGTEPLALLTNATPSLTTDQNLPLITRYIEGTHGNPISAGQQGADPGSSSAVFTEMTTQMLQLFTTRTDASTSGTVRVVNPCVVQSTVDGADCTPSSPPSSGGDGDGGDDGGDGGLPIPLPF